MDELRSIINSLDPGEYPVLKDDDFTRDSIEIPEVIKNHIVSCHESVILTSDEITFRNWGSAFVYIEDSKFDVISVMKIKDIGVIYTSKSLLISELQVNISDPFLEGCTDLTLLEYRHIDNLEVYKSFTVKNVRIESDSYLFLKDLI